MNIPKLNSKLKVNSGVIANYFLEKGFEEEKPITLNKLLELVYISNICCLEKINFDTLDGEKALPLDPLGKNLTILSLFNEFKRFGNKSIDTFYIELVEEEPIFVDIEDIVFKKYEIKNKIILILELVWEKCRDYSDSDFLNRIKDFLSRIYRAMEEKCFGKNVDYEKRI